MLKQLFLKFIILLVPEFVSHEKNSASLFFEFCSSFVSIYCF